MSDKVQRYKAAVQAFDCDALGELRHPDYECYYPQSGERFIGHENWVAAHRDYASHFAQDNVNSATVKGGARKVDVARRVSPGFAMSAPIVLVSDTGHLATMEGHGTWPDGKVYYWCRIIEFKEGLVYRETEYFAEPFEAPEWRTEFAEREER
ncbi:MAG TPA: hypothetical protein VLG28_12115 [Acidimicrobiia bacterium]|jgi:hypothetical protein|nr:hypothetical protein [Acidimicrobiia bacterium]